MTSCSRKRARKQATTLARADDADEGDYNIWYHKKAGRRAPGSSKVAAKTRCVGARDSGGTRGSDARALTFCLHFARGCCVRGHACHYLHRVPCAVDENELEARCDIFGRERHATDREDMGGVGSFTSDSRTLYVGGLAGGAKAGVRGGASPLRDALSRQFGEWGRVESLRVFPGHAFVTFVLRACAEFAREAMQNQSLGVGDGANAPRLAPILNVRWATDDPNPRAKRRKRAVAASALVAAAAARAPPLPPPPRAASSAQRLHDEQLAWAAWQQQGEQQYAFAAAAHASCGTSALPAPTASGADAAAGGVLGLDGYSSSSSEEES